MPVCMHMYVFFISGENWQFTANVCPSAVAAHCCYYHKVNEQLHIGAELESSLMTRESVGKGCYQLEIPGGNAMFRGKSEFYIENNY